ncbi:hypothetical protein [Agromyces seonyuensis]|uniref:Uncharacterized protein n=1 Tax=Agromyces seonyuensis TaxID=2662446 RepID=A0A6I4P4H6_9MICO|nr:hypothetical protein [Agromyces seonyuensis]MWB98317.1 hypothetical protein [Agromyces seonyuensis]
MDAWHGFWTWANENQLAATVVGGLILLALGWALSHLPKVGPYIRRALTWLWAWHPVSARRHTRELDRLRKSLKFGDSEVQGAAKKSALEGDARLRIALDADFKAIKQRLDRQEKNHEAVAALVVSLESEIKRGPGASAVAEPLAPTSPPLPRPRWDIEWLAHDDGTPNSFFDITNHVPRSVANEVRIEGTSRVRVRDAGHWASLSGKVSEQFVAQVAEEGEYLGVRFSVEWYDEDGAKQREEVTAPPWEDDPDAEQRVLRL